MKKAGFIAVIFLLCCQAADAQTTTRYLSSLPDVPLMPQMREVKEANVVFDKAEGRIVEETAKAQNLQAADVLKFYGETLPALGWTRLSPERFSRKGEQLVVNAEKVQDEGLIRFSLSPVQP